MKNGNKQDYKFLLTINNPDKYGYDFDKIKSILVVKPNFVYFCMAMEKGKTLHIHVFIAFSSRVRWSTVKRLFPEAHIDVCKGTVSDNVNYIKKSGKWKEDPKHKTSIKGTFREYGERPPDSSGHEIDMTELFDMINAGMSSYEIICQNQDYMLHLSTIERTRTTILQAKYSNERRLDIHVVYIYGATRTGKTRGVLDEHGDSNVYRIIDYKHPFDGYACQGVLVFDEYRSSLPLQDMLEYLDVYPTELPARYSNKFACYDYVYIISNWSLEKQYEEEQTEDKESWEAFLARIHEVWHYTAPGQVVKYKSVDDYMNREEWVKVDPKDVPLDDEEFMELPDDNGEQMAIPFE